MISDHETDLSIFGNSSSLIVGSIGIIDWDWCGSCMSWDVMLLDEVLVDGATGAPTVC